MADKQVWVRLPEELLNRIDERVAQADDPYGRPSRSEVMRRLLDTGLRMTAPKQRKPKEPAT